MARSRPTYERQRPRNMRRSMAPPIRWPAPPNAPCRTRRIPAAPAGHTAHGVDRRRPGFSLLEVILALAILVGAAAVVGQLWQVATRAAVQNELQTEAVVRAETVLNEVLAGVYPLQSQTEQPFEDDPAWTWSVDVQPLDAGTLQLVTVTVRYDAASAYGPVELTLSRRHLVPPQSAETDSEFEMIP